MTHLGIGPGDRVEVEALPGGVLRMRAARPGGTIEDFLHALDGKVTPGETLSIDDINRIIAATRYPESGQPRDGVHSCISRG
jgi:hypothetical protein